MMMTKTIMPTMLTMTIQVGDWFHDQVPHRSRHPCGAGDLCCPWTAMIIVIIIIMIIILIAIATARSVTWMQTTGSGVAQKTWIWEGQLTPSSSSPRNTNINTNRYVHTVITFIWSTSWPKWSGQLSLSAQATPVQILQGVPSKNRLWLDLKDKRIFKLSVTTYLLWQAPTFSSKTRTLPMQQPFLVSRFLILCKHSGNANIGLAFQKSVVICKKFFAKN